MQRQLFLYRFHKQFRKKNNEHNQGIHPESYTFKRRPVELVWFEMFTDPNHAIAIEKQIKGWSRRKKQAIINADWDKLVLYSKNYTQFGKDGTSTSSVWHAKFSYKSTFVPLSLSKRAYRIEFTIAIFINKHETSTGSVRHAWFNLTLRDQSDINGTLWIAKFIRENNFKIVFFNT